MIYGILCLAWSDTCTRSLDAIVDKEEKGERKRKGKGRERKRGGRKRLPPAGGPKVGPKGGIRPSRPPPALA